MAPFYDVRRRVCVLSVALLLHICCFEVVFSAFGLLKNEGQQGGQRGRPDRNFSMATFQGTQQLKFKRKVEAFFLSLRMNAQHSQGLAKMKNETRLKVLIYERETYGQNGQN